MVKGANAWFQANTFNPSKTLHAPSNAQCNQPRGGSPLVSPATSHYDICFVLPPISPCTISLGAAACSLTHSLLSYRCPIPCSLYYIGMMCGGPCLAPDY